MISCDLHVQMASITFAAFVPISGHCCSTAVRILSTFTHLKLRAMLTSLHNKLEAGTLTKLSIKFAHCYGIPALEHSFDFSNNNMPVAIYAPNGVMKTSFAKAFRGFSTGANPEDLIFSERVSSCEIWDHAGAPTVKEAIFVIDSINEKYKSDRISTLLASAPRRCPLDLIKFRVRSGPKRGPEHEAQSI